MSKAMVGKLTISCLRRNFPKEGVWRKLITRWGKVLNLYLKDEGKYDVPHWHIERSHVGFLAAAVWARGGVALEEYAVKRGKRSGRCDLYFALDGVDCLVEAKHDNYLSYSEISFSRNIDRIGTLLDKASKQLHKLLKNPDERADYGLALCWAVPCLKKDRQDSKDVLKKIAEQFERDDHIVAFYSVPPSKRQGHERKYEKGYTYPGVVLVGRLVCA